MSDRHSGGLLLGYGIGAVLMPIVLRSTQLDAGITTINIACDLPWFHAVRPVDGAFVLFQAWKNGSQGLSGGGYQIYGCNAD